MINIFKYISFHFAVFILATIIFITVLGGSKYHGYLQLFIWLCHCGLIFFIICYISGAHKFKYWSQGETTGASIVIIVGHLGPAHAVYYYMQMAKVGYGSGVVFIPSIFWAIFFYGIGVFWCLSRISEVKYKKDRSQN